MGNEIEYKHDGPGFINSSKSKNCPLCGDSDGLHIQAVVVNAGGQITIVDSGGTHMKAGEPYYRGVAVITYYGCELCGDTSSVKEHFHKGSVFVTTEKEDPQNPLFAGKGPDIWRD